MKAIIVSCLVLGIVLAACSSGSSGVGGTSGGGGFNPASCAGVAPVDGVASESRDDACGSPSLLPGTKAAGEACSGFSDCKPVCCTCTGKSKSGLAASCNKGVCAGSDGVCCSFAGSASCAK